MKPVHGPQTIFFNNYCSEIPGPANYDMPSEVCGKQFLCAFFASMPVFIALKAIYKTKHNIKPIKI